MIGEGLSRLREILGMQFSSPLERASNVTDLLLASKDNFEQIRIMTFLVRHGLFVIRNEKHGRGRTIPEDHLAVLKEEIGRDLTRVFHSWVRKNLEEEDLAGRLWNYLKRFYGERDKLDYSIAFLLLERHIPYRMIPHLELLQEIKSKIEGALSFSDSEEQLLEHEAVLRNASQQANDIMELATIAARTMNQCNVDERYILMINFLDTLVADVQRQTWKEAKAMLKDASISIGEEIFSDNIEFKSFRNLGELLQFLQEEERESNRDFDA